MKTSGYCALALVIICSCQQQPEAMFSSDKTTIYVGETVSFQNQSVDSKSYEWDFGDGTNSVEQHPSKEYSQSGTYCVSLTSFSKNGRKRSFTSAKILVKDQNEDFVGVYRMSGSSCSSNQYDLSLTRKGNTEIIISNLNGKGITVVGGVQGDRLTIPIDQYPYSQGYLEIYGWATIGESGNVNFVINESYTDCCDSSLNTLFYCNVSGSKL